MPAHGLSQGLDIGGGGQDHHQVHQVVDVGKPVAAELRDGNSAVAARRADMLACPLDVATPDKDAAQVIVELGLRVQRPVRLLQHAQAGTVQLQSLIQMTSMEGDPGQYRKRDVRRQAGCAEHDDEEDGHTHDSRKRGAATGLDIHDRAHGSASARQAADFQAVCGRLQEHKTIKQIRQALETKKQQVDEVMNGLGQ